MCSFFVRETLELFSFTVMPAVVPGLIPERRDLNGGSMRLRRRTSSRETVWKFQAIGTSQTRVLKVSYYELNEFPISGKTLLRVLMPRFVNIRPSNPGLKTGAEYARQWLACSAAV